MNAAFWQTRSSAARTSSRIAAYCAFKSKYGTFIDRTTEYTKDAADETIFRRAGEHGKRTDSFTLASDVGAENWPIAKMVGVLAVC
jgi:hypothetical protein